jgi:hypothetical protein
MTDQNPELRGGNGRGSTDELSEAEFERAEDLQDDMTRPRGVTRTAWQRRQKHTVLTAALVFAALISAVVVIDAGKSSPSRPSCQARTANCRETADGFWVPVWYYGGLALAQGIGRGTGRAPSAAGAQPSASELEQSGATPDETDEAQSYDESANSAASSDDSGSDDSGSDDSGDGDGGGGDDGGD